MSYEQLGPVHVSGSILISRAFLRCTPFIFFPRGILRVF